MNNHMKSLEEVEQELISMGFVEHTGSLYKELDIYCTVIPLSYHTIHAYRYDLDVPKDELPVRVIDAVLFCRDNNGDFKLSYKINKTATHEMGMPIYNFYYLNPYVAWEIIPDTDDVASVIVLYGK